MFRNIGESEKNIMIERLNDIKNIKRLSNAGIKIPNIKMDDSVYDENSMTNIEYILDMMKSIKMVSQAGYEINNINLDLDYAELWDCKIDTFTAIVECITEQYTYGMASEENGLLKGYTLWQDEDEVTVSEIIISEKNIMKYLKNYGEKAINENTDEILNVFHCYDGYEEATTAFIAEDLSGVVILINNSYYINNTMIEAILELIEYCKQENKKFELEEKSNGNTAA